MRRAPQSWTSSPHRQTNPPPAPRNPRRNPPADGSASGPSCYETEGRAWHAFAGYRPPGWLLLPSADSLPSPFYRKNPQRDCSGRRNVSSFVCPPLWRQAKRDRARPKGRSLLFGWSFWDAPRGAALSRRVPGSRLLLEVGPSLTEIRQGKSRLVEGTVGDATAPSKASWKTAVCVSCRVPQLRRTVSVYRCLHSAALMIYRHKFRIGA